MSKKLFIAEKPSVAQEFAKALKKSTARKDGYLEGEDVVITWCVGHLVTMSYPEVYDEIPGVAICKKTMRPKSRIVFYDYSVRQSTLSARSIARSM